MIRISQIRKQTSPELEARCREALDKILASKKSGFPELGERDSLWTESRNVGESLRRRFDHLVVMGTGGSSLGGQVIANMRMGSRLRFIDNVDTLALERALYGLNLRHTGFLIVSKSGGTIETLSAVDFLRERLSRVGVDLKKQSHVLTESETNSLATWAKKNSVGLTVIPSDIGGRYSVLSPVGMIPAIFDDGNEQAFRAGTRRAMEQRDLAARLMAQSWLSFERNEWITFFWFYDPLARLLGGWLQQLWAESLGKKVDRQGRPAPRASTPMAALGTVDQHSVLQQVAEGAHDKFVVFVRSEAAEQGGPSLEVAEFPETKSLQGRTLGALLKAEALATEEALSREGVSTLTLTTEVLDEEGLGEFFMLMQMVVAGLGEMLGIDPFDQPGVELGKRLAKEFLQKP